MKFAKLVLEKYGLYDRRAIDLRADAQLHVILGHNEAGKSTALSAIGDLLFGFPNVSPYAIGYSPNTMRLGAELLLRDGSCVSFRRRKGRSNTIVDANDTALGDDLLDPLLGSMDRTTFETEFGLTAERLRKGGDELLAAGGKLAETLAAGSAGLSALNRLKARLQSEADEMFTTRKVASKPFYLAADAYAAANRDLREAIVSVDEVKQGEDRLAASAAQQKHLEEERAETARQLSRLTRVRDTSAKLRELETIEQELARLPAPPQAAAGQLAAWREALKREDELRQATTSLGNALAKNAADMAALNEQPDVLASAQEIATINRAAGAAEDYRKDLPRREREHHAALSKLEGAARALGHASTDALIAAMPTNLALADVREAVKRRRNSVAKADGLQERLAKAKARRDELERQIEKDGHAADPAELKRAFETFRDLPADAAALQRQSGSIRQDLRTIENRLARLSPPPPPLRDLVAMAFPDAAKVDAIRQQEQNLAGDLNRLDQDLGEQTGALDKAERALQRLEQVRTLVTRDDLLAARKERDVALQVLRNAKASENDAALHALDAANAKLDRITDQLLANADDAARKLTLEQERQRLNESLAILRDSRKHKHEEQRELAQTWRDLWANIDVEPDTPTAMTRWLGEVGHAIADYDALSSDKKEMEALRESLAEQEKPLKALLMRLGGAPFEEASIQHVYDAAKAALEDMESRWTERRMQANDLQNAIREIEAIERDIEALEAEQQAQAGQWRSATAILHCKPDASVEMAEEALRIWGETLVAYDKFSDETSRLTGVRKRIADFEAKVRELCARLAPDLTDGDAYEAVEELNARLQAARDAAHEMDRLRKEAVGMQQQIEKHEAEYAEAQATIRTAARILMLDDDAGLGAALDRLARREELLAGEAAAHHDLAAMTNGLSAQALRAEREGIDFDTLAGDIARLEDRLEQIRDEEKAAFAAARDADTALQQLLKGRNAAGLAQRKQEAGAELVDISRRWLVRAAAARLAAQAIERHRQSAQDPVMARASALFSRATGGAFEGLAMRFGDNDALVFRAVRASGEDVAVDGLSDGTRDQLYLALRLALLEQRRGEPLPFVGDDLLTSFDEERTGQALEMLAESGNARQTILFTHHRHVADIASERLGERLDLIEL